jgi:hypothetical protein
MGYLNNLKQNHGGETNEDFLTSFTSGEKTSIVYKILNYGEMYVNLEMDLQSEELGPDGNLDFRLAKEKTDVNQKRQKQGEMRFKENFCGKVDRVRNVVMMRLETH